MSSDEDDARLLAALTLAFRSAALDGSADDSFEARLARLGDAMSGQRWQITVARDLKLSVGSWVAHPWHCWKLRRLVRLLLAENLDPRRETQAVDLLTRCAAMVEFGVDVNAAWYRRLRTAVAEGRATSRKLRSLLRSATVWWGTSPQAKEGRRSSVPLQERLRSMGRPDDGELLISQHHWVTKLFLSILLALSGFALGAVVMGSARHLATGGSAKAMGPAIVAAYTYGIMFWAAWWFGPRSWTAAQQLRKLLDSDE